VPFAGIMSQPPSIGLNGLIGDEPDRSQGSTYSLRQEPFREIDGVPVFHASCKVPLFAPVTFDMRKVSRWGRMDHPMVVACSYEMVGEMRLSLNTRVDGFSIWT
jgi:hypothetical protein